MLNEEILRVRAQYEQQFNEAKEELQELVDFLKNISGGSSGRQLDKPRR